VRAGSRAAPSPPGCSGELGLHGLNILAWKISLPLLVIAHQVPTLARAGDVPLRSHLLQLVPDLCPRMAVRNGAQVGGRLLVTHRAWLVTAGSPCISWWSWEDTRSTISTTVDRTKLSRVV
jgi:hypothetical protein